MLPESTHRRNEWVHHLWASVSCMEPPEVTQMWMGNQLAKKAFLILHIQSMVNSTWWSSGYRIPIKLSYGLGVVSIWDCLLTTVSIKKMQDFGERICIHCWWEGKWTMEIRVAASPKTENRALMWPSYPSQRITQTCTSTVTAALFTVARKWEQLRWPSTDEWKKKM